MHPTAYENGKKFVDKYLGNKANEHIKILDVGSFDANGSLKSLFIYADWEYIGIDIRAGKNVDVVLEDIYKYPYEDGYFDAVISTSAFEHDIMFWVTFREMVRVTKHGGNIYICAPSTGPVHRYSLDCWRFYPDAYKALAMWCPEAKIIESYIDDTSKAWKDNIGIFEIEKK